jgi:hypothetical protein
MSFLADRKVPRVVACLGQGATKWLPIVDIRIYCLLPLSGSSSLVLSNEVQPVEVVSCSSFLVRVCLFELLLLLLRSKSSSSNKQPNFVKYFGEALERNRRTGRCRTEASWELLSAASRASQT